MTTAIIELNDAGIRVGTADELLLSSPGYAVLDGNQLYIGEDGRRHSRLLPRWTNNRFWNQLGTEPVPNGTDLVRHHADLAFAHLEHVWQRVDGISDVIFAVPGFYSREQLGLLLGMARECGIRVSGVVDSSVAAVANEPLTPTVLHLDIFLHRITLSVMRAGSDLVVDQTVTVSESGLFTLWDRWANIVASQFIQSSRFDPMHQADSEQALYDQLPGWVAALTGERTTTFDLAVGGDRRSVAVSKDQLMNACASIYPQIVQLIRDHIPVGTGATVYISDRFRGFPGLEDSLGLIADADVRHLPETSIIAGAEHHRENIQRPDGAVAHVKLLPAGATVASPLRASARHPTHLLAGHHAQPVGSALRISDIQDDAIIVDAERAVCTVYIRGDKTLLEVHGNGVTVNGEHIEQTCELNAGDRLATGGAEALAVTVG